MELPDNLLDAQELIIRVKDNTSNSTKSNFGTGLYMFRISHKYPEVSIENRIRLHPIENGIVSDMCHMIAAYMGYKDIRDKFEVVQSKYED